MTLFSLFDPPPMEFNYQESCQGTWLYLLVIYLYKQDLSVFFKIKFGCAISVSFNLICFVSVYIPLWLGAFFNSKNSSLLVSTTARNIICEQNYSLKCERLSLYNRGMKWARRLIAELKRQQILLNNIILPSFLK